MSESDELSLLPPRTRLLARQIGLPALKKLSKRWGGVRIYVPSRDRLDRSHELVKCIGMEAANELAEEEGKRLDVPMCNQAVNAELYRQIREYRQTHSERETALHFKVSDRWVRYLMATAETAPSPQSDLFKQEKGDDRAGRNRRE